MLEMGLLWYEPSRGVPLAERIDAAAARYIERFGELPNVCLVAASELEPFDRIAVRSDTRMRPGYLLIGVERDETLPEWEPVHRSSDDVEVALLAPDGRVVRRLRPVRRRSVRTPTITPASEATLPRQRSRQQQRSDTPREAVPGAPLAARTGTVTVDRPRRCKRET